MRHLRTALVADQRGSLFVELLIVFPAFALLLLLAQWVARYNGGRGEVLEQVAGCALDQAVAGCGSPPPSCRDVTTTTADYGGGPTPTGLGGRELRAAREVGFARPRGLGSSPTRYQTRYRVSCNVPDGTYRPAEVVRNVCLTHGDPRTCAVW